MAERGEDPERDPDDDGQDEGHEAELDGRPDAVGDDVVDGSGRGTDTTGPRSPWMKSPTQVMYWT